jgi:DNA-binding transcriptional LysR family regulator
LGSLNVQNTSRAYAHAIVAAVLTSPPAAGGETERSPAFEARHLAALVAVSQTGSFRVAGERLGYVQSAVSRQISTLEEVAGTRLVERSSGANEVALTQAGELLVRHGEALLARQTAARADLERLAAGETGVVRVGVPQGVGPRLLRRVLDVYRERRPQTRVVASEFATDAPLFALVEQGVLDLALAALPLPPGPFEHRRLLRVRWVLATPSRWSLGRRGDAIQLAELAERPLVARHGDRCGPPLEAQLQAAGHVPNVVFRTDIDDTVRTLVATGVGAGLLPTYSVATDDPAIATHTVDSVPLAQSIALFWHRERVLSPAAAELRAVVMELSPSGDRKRPPSDDVAQAARP